MIMNITIVFVFGLLIGSFLNVCVYRIPRGESMVKPPSHCCECTTKLKAYDMVPVISYVILRGKCRFCGSKIPISYPLVEVLTALAFATLFGKYGLTVDFFSLACLISILVVVFFVDLKHRIIPDELVVFGLGLGVLIAVYNVFYQVKIYGDGNWWNPLLGIAVGSGTLFVIALIGFIVYKTDDAMGMGDVKIFAPIGMFLGWRITGVALFISVLLGGIAGLILIAFRLKKKRDAIPFGPFIVSGTFIAAVWGWDILNWYLNRL